jgi:hypothetical protein
MPQDTFYSILPEFESKMAQAAISWKKGNYSRALDGFLLARDLISLHMPTPIDAYGWNWSRSLKTYTIVLARLVELDLIVKSGKTELLEETRHQAVEWGDVLQVQAMDWRKVESQNEEEKTIRNRWIGRYVQAIRQVRTVCAAKGPGEE